MKLALLAAFLALPLCAQQVTDLYAGGVSSAPAASQPLAVTGLWAHSINDDNQYSFVVADAVPTSTKPLTVSTNVGVGIAQKAFTISKYTVYVPTAAGISWTGKNTGWQWSSGAMVPIPIKSFYICPAARFLKSSVSNGSDYQVIFSLLFGIGKH